MSVAAELASPTNLASSLLHWICGTYGATDPTSAAWLINADGDLATLGSFYDTLLTPVLVGPGGLDTSFDSRLRGGSPLLVATLPMPAGHTHFVGGYAGLATWRVNLWLRCAVWMTSPADRLDHDATARQFASAVDRVTRLLTWHGGQFELRSFTAEDGMGATRLANVLLDVLGNPTERPGDWRADWNLRLRLVREKG